MVAVPTLIHAKRILRPPSGTVLHRLALASVSSCSPEPNYEGQESDCDLSSKLATVHLSESNS